MNQLVSATQALHICTVSALQLTCLHLHDGAPQDGTVSGGHRDTGLCPGAWGSFGWHQDTGWPVGRELRPASGGPQKPCTQVGALLGPLRAATCAGGTLDIPRGGQVTCGHTTGHGARL